MFPKRQGTTSFERKGLNYSKEQLPESLTKQYREVNFVQIKFFYIIGKLLKHKYLKVILKKKVESLIFEVPFST
jgi:hypothetical protein